MANIPQEINEFSADKDRPILLWLFSKYHLASQWNFVAKVEFRRYGIASYQVNRVWIPTIEGRILYDNRSELPSNEV